MDYERLYSEIPKQPIKWNVSDIELWLRFIGMSNLYPRFKQLAIDGSILNSLTEEDLRQELNIKSGIAIKKVMSWVRKGLREYDEFLKNLNAGASTMIFESRDITQKPKPTKATSISEEPPVLLQQSSYRSITDEREKYDIQPLPVGSNIDIIETEGDAMDEEEGEKKKEFELIIQQYDGPQTSFFSVKENGAKIGRHSSNQILILDESISRFHAEILFKEEKFLLRDTGSTTGTFIKIIQKCEIFPEMIFQMGSNQFQAHFVNGNLMLEIIEGPSQGLRIQIPKHRVSIGRKQNNELYFPDDQHLSNMHATISPIEGKSFLEDMGTTNGTWRRLSLQGEGSTSFQLADNIIFKVGSSQTYCCKIKTAFFIEKTNPNACIICYENDKDCVYMPCKHNTACIKCSKNLKECPICRFKIEDFIRIYKS